MWAPVMVVVGVWAPGLLKAYTQPGLPSGQALGALLSKGNQLDPQQCS